jgi:hypothetical protein
MDHQQQQLQICQLNKWNQPIVDHHSPRNFKVIDHFPCCSFCKYQLDGFPKKPPKRPT